MEKNDLVEEKTTKEERPARKTTKAQAEPVKKSKRKVSFKEYMLGKNIRRETQAAIKITLGDDLFHFKSDWDKIVADFIDEEEEV